MDDDYDEVSITYDSNDVIIHYPDGDVRVPNYSGSSTFGAEPQGQLRRGIDAYIRESHNLP